MTNAETPKSNRPSLPLMVTVFLVTMVVSVAIAYAVLSQIIEPPPTTLVNNVQPRGDGVREILHPFEVQDFTFQTQNEEFVSLSDLRGQYVLLYFGYTHCPDVCLITLSEIRLIHEQLGEQADDLQYVFVSVDGERDTPARMRQHFEPRGVADYMLGMTGTEPTLTRIGVDYGLFYSLNKDEGEYYTVDHSANLYLISPEGRLEAIFAFGTEVDVIVEYIQERL